MNTTYLAGNLAIARLIIYESCHLLMIGDSIFGGMTENITRTWRVNIVGMGIPARGSTSLGYTQSPALTYGATSNYNSSSPAPNGLGGWTMNRAGTGFGSYFVFDGDVVEAQTTHLKNRCYEICTNRPVQWRGTSDWINNKNLTAEYLHLANSAGCESFGLAWRDQSGFATYATASGFSSRNATPTYTTASINLAARDHSADSPVVVLRPTPGTTPANGDNLVHVAARIYQSDATTGLQLSNWGIGGQSAAHYNDNTNWSQEGITGLLQFLDTNVVMIWLGQNDGGNTSYPTNINGLITKFKTAMPNCKIVLVSPYQTLPASWGGGLTAEDYSDVLRGIANSRADVLFLDLWRATGGSASASTNYTTINTNWLGDGVHPSNPNGANYFAATLWDLIEQAAELAAPVWRPRIRRL